MNRLSKLPTEVLTSITSLLTCEDLVPLTKTSKLLRSLALRDLFRNYSIRGLNEGEYWGFEAPSKRTANFNKTLGLLKSVNGASEHVRNLYLGLPPAPVEISDSWAAKEIEPDRKADEPILSDEMLQELLKLLPGLRGLQSCVIKFETNMDFLVAFKVISALPWGSSDTIQKLVLSGWPKYNPEEFNAAVTGEGAPVPKNLKDLKIDLTLEASNCIGYPESLPAFEKALTGVTNLLLSASTKTLTRLSLEVGVDLNGTPDCHSHMEVDLDALAEAPLRFLELTALRKEDESDNIPKICKYWAELEELRLIEYWPARRAITGGEEWCGGMGLMKWRKQWTGSMKSLQKLKTLFLSYDLERDANDLQENIFDQHEDDSESKDADDQYRNWEKRNIERRLKVSRKIARSIPVLESVEWRNQLDDGNLSEYRYQVLRDEDGEISDIKIHSRWWDDSEDDDEEDEEEEEGGEEGSDDEWTDEELMSQSAFENTLDFGTANDDQDAEDAEGEAAL